MFSVTGLRSMQFSQGSIKELGAISGWLNKAIVAFAATSQIPPSPQKPARRDFTRGFNLPFSETDPTETVLRQRRGCRAFSHGIQWGQGWIGLSVELYRVSLSALCSRWGVARRIEGGRRSVEKGGAGRAWKDRRNDLWWERESPPFPRCSWQAVIFSVYPIVNAPWPAVCHASAVSN